MVGGGGRGWAGACGGKTSAINIKKKSSGVTYLLTPRIRVLLEKLTGSQLAKTFPAFYGTRSFITAFISASELSLS